MKNLFSKAANNAINTGNINIIKNLGAMIMRKFNELKEKAIEKINSIFFRAKGVLVNESGDQFTGFLIMVLLVVVVGAAFLLLYQSSITDIWNGIITKIKSTFGI